MEYCRPSAPPATHSNREIDVQVKCLCHDCNHGWLSDMEEATRPVLTPMIKGQHVSLSPNDQTLIATWMMKLTLLLPHTDSSAPNPFTPQDRARFRHDRLPLPLTWIWLAGYKGSTSAVQSWGRFPAHREQPTPVSDPAALCNVTVSVGHLALQLLALRTQGPDLQESNRDWVPITTGIWPSGGTVTWPPRFSLDDPRFNSFIRRWDDLLRG
jgi:hypothetical protein